MVLPLLAHSLAEQVESGTINESFLTEINRTAEIMVRAIEKLAELKVVEVAVETNAAAVQADAEF